MEYKITEMFKNGITIYDETRDSNVVSVTESLVPMTPGIMAFDIKYKNGSFIRVFNPDSVVYTPIETEES